MIIPSKEEASKRLTPRGISPVSALLATLKFLNWPSGKGGISPRNPLFCSINSVSRGKSAKDAGMGPEKWLFSKSSSMSPSIPSNAFFGISPDNMLFEKSMAFRLGTPDNLGKGPVKMFPAKLTASRLGNNARASTSIVPPNPMLVSMRLLTLPFTHETPAQLVVLSVHGGAALVQFDNAELLVRDALNLTRASASGNSAEERAARLRKMMRNGAIAWERVESMLSFLAIVAMA